MSKKKKRTVVAATNDDQVRNAKMLEVLIVLQTIVRSILALRPCDRKMVYDNIGFLG